MCTDIGLHIGPVTRQLLNWFLDEGDISSGDAKQFYSAVRDFYTWAAVASLPLKDSVLQNAKFVDFTKRDLHSYSQVEYFVWRYVCAQIIKTYKWVVVFKTTWLYLFYLGYSELLQYETATE